MNFTRRFIPWLLVLLIPLAGFDCSVSGRSGGSTIDREEDKAGLIVIIADGQFVDSPVSGVRYESGDTRGFTGPDGQFQYEEGQPVRFYIGDILLGQAVAGRPVLTPLDLVPSGTLDTPAVLNIARLLQSLDAIPGDDRITIPATMDLVAVRSDTGLAAAIDSLDFEDETAFINAASQLVATLTRDYPFTATLVDTATARAHLAASLEAAGLLP